MAEERVHGVVPREVLTAESGLAFLQGLIEGRHPAPPFSGTTDIYLTEADEGRVVFTGVPSAGFFNPLGTIHGGWTSAILDSAMACAVHTTLAAGQGYTTVEMKLNFVRPVLPSSRKAQLRGPRHPPRCNARDVTGQARRRAGAPPRPRHRDLPHLRRSGPQGHGGLSATAETGPAPSFRATRSVEPGTHKRYRFRKDCNGALLKTPAFIGSGFRFAAPE